MTDLCREFGISRRASYRIYNLVKQEGPVALCDRSRRRTMAISGSIPNRAIDQALVDQRFQSGKLDPTPRAAPSDPQVCASESIEQSTAAALASPCRAGLRSRTGRLVRVPWRLPHAFCSTSVRSSSISSSPLFSSPIISLRASAVTLISSSSFAWRAAPSRF